ncbi:hypothetical protein RCG17_19700 [Neobacillus sp. PS3-12]|uniref:hypothetical protein n=1 Tax=Neobacillus sp. PS3-12 TaxID=3070677 RepID=UPI0027E15F51|nr:hypothetical protein [Neobacillus sp. PS3-12]WML51643.1 hypothetical protein RCG17_19700 [Neobacillus sp. PS3-12]
MSKFKILAMLLLIVCSFFLHLLALMDTFPLILSIPLLFGSFFLFFMMINYRNKFKGF